MRHLGLVSCFIALATFTSVSAAPPDGREPSQVDKKKPGRDGAKKKAKAADEPGVQKRRDLEAWGVLKEVKGTQFFTLDYTKVNGRKTTRHSAFLKLAEGADFYTDRSIKITDLNEGDSIWLLGRLVENEIPGQGGLAGGTDRQIQNVLAVAAGEGLSVNTKYRDPKDPNVKWLEATVAKVGPSIDVKHENQRYKVVLTRAAPVLRREMLGDAKLLKSGTQVEVSGDKSEEKPESKGASDAKKESFLLKKIAILDRRLTGTLYPALFP